MVGANVPISSKIKRIKLSKAKMIKEILFQLLSMLLSPVVLVFKLMPSRSSDRCVSQGVYCACVRLIL